MKPEVSIVIPHFNSGGYINNLISTLRNVDFAKEIIVVDDNSTDRSVESLQEKFEDINILINAEEKGAAYCRNRGIENSSGRYILLIDQDVKIQRDCIRRLYQAIKSSNVDIVAPKIVFDNEQPMYPTTKNDEDFICLSAIFIIRRDALSQLDELFDDTYFIRFEDTDFFERSRLFGLTYKYVKTAKAYHPLKNPSNSERIFYWDVRNSVYSFLKFRGIKTRNFSLSKFMFWIFEFALTILLNISWHHYYHENILQRDWKYKFELVKNIVLNKHIKITSKGRYYLVRVFLQGISWNLTHMSHIKRKNREMIEKLKRTLASESPENRLNINV